MAEDLIITLGLKDLGAKKQITGLNKELRMLDKEFKATNRGSKEFEQGTAKLEKQLGLLEKKYKANESKLKAYNQVMNDTKDALAKKKAELEKLTTAENVNEKAVEKCKTQIANLEQTLNKTAREIGLTEEEMKDLESQIKATQTAIDNKPYTDARAKLNELADSATKAGEKMQQAGEKMNSMGNTLLGISAPIIAFGAYATKAAMDFEAGMAKVQAISGATGQELEQLKEKAREMGEKTKFSATESAEALQYMSMAGWKTNDMLDGLEGIMNLAAASGESLALVSDIVTDALSAFGMEAKDAGKFSDILAAASSNANTNVAMMGETFKYVAPIAGAMKYSAEDTAIAIGLMANSGIKASQSGTSLRQVLMGLQGGVEVATKSGEKFRIEVENQDGTMRDFRSVLIDLRTAFGEMTDAQKAQNAESIAGKVGMSGLLAIVNASEKDFNKLAKAVDNSAGKSKEMADIMNATAQGQLTLLNSKLESLGITIGARILPHVNKFIDGLSNLIEWFGNLGEGTQDAIMKFGLYTAATGLALKAVGTLTKGLGGLVKGVGSSIRFMAKFTKETSLLGKAAKLASGTNGVGGVVSAVKLLAPAAAVAGAGVAALAVGVQAAKTQSELLTRSVATAEEELTGWERAVAKMNGTQFKSREELMKSNLVYKEFNENISPEFQEAIKDSQLAIVDFTATMHGISMDNVLNKEEIKVFNEGVKGMCDTAIATIKEKQKESSEALSEMFKLDDKKIDEKEKKVIEILQKHSQTQIDEVSKLEGEIYKIKDTAVKAKRGLNDKEIADIEAKLTRIKEIELEALGSNQEEILYAKNEFAARVATMDLESASTLLQEKAKLRDEEITKIQASYDTQIQMMEEKLPQLNEKDRLAVEEQIKKHQEARDKKIEGEMTLYDELLRITGEKNPELLGELNKYNGQILTMEDKKAQETQRQYMSNFAELSKITESGTYRMYNQHSGMWENVTVEVDKRSGEIIASYADVQKKGAGYTADLGKSMADLGKKHNEESKSIQKALKESSDLTVTSSGDMVDANGKIITSLEDMETAADGTKTGIVKLNGTPVKVEVNKEGAVSNLDAIRKAVESIPTRRTVTITTQQNGPSPQSIAGPQSLEPQVASVNTLVNAKIKPAVADVTGFNNVIMDPGYYTKSNPILNTINNYSSRSSNTSTSINNQNFNLNGIGETIAAAIGQALTSLIVENNVELKLNEKVLCQQVSQGMARVTRGKR